ncbi:hypothetical protein EV421DRAFT_1911104 [Armillaria borealis]|uniref:Aminoglycoside phosphotransferase domain-containing protein n=1 Tax=Armillaria borealis TaxID=47425 RepID=A0AA39MFF2_9AGAR|nr:hypothetical protein EV421DRAFT_1911104 [Armillaria borealis]
MASYITAAAWLAQESLSRGIDTNSSFARSSYQNIPEIHRLLEKCIAVAPHLAPPDSSSLLSPLLVHPDTSASNMLIESPAKPSITCFLDWRPYLHFLPTLTASSSLTLEDAYRLFRKTPTSATRAGIPPAAPQVAIPVSVLPRSATEAHDHPCCCMAISGSRDADGTNDIPGDEELLPRSRFSLDQCARPPSRHSPSHALPVMHIALAYIRQL